MEDKLSEKVDIATILEENKIINSVKKIEVIEKNIEEKENKISEIKEKTLPWLATGEYGYSEAEKEIRKIEKEVKTLKAEKESVESKDMVVENTNISDGASKSEIIKVKKEIAKLKEELATLREKLDKPVIDLKLEKGNLKTDTIQTTTDMYASGNGISVQKEGDKGAEFGGLENEGVVSGYTEVYHGQLKGKYSRIAHQLSGAGLAIRGDVEEKITNVGLISGSDFALLAKGRRNNALSIQNPTFETGFEGGVDNYGLLAGRVIVGGYEVVADPDIEEGYGYFETIYNEENKYKNYGMYLVFDKYRNLKDTIIGETGSYNGKQIINIQKDTPITDTVLNNKIVNGFGKNGVVSATDKTELKESIVNGFKTAVKMEDNSTLKLEDSILNANGFDSKVYGETYAILGSEGKNIVEASDVRFNGRVSLGKGEDSLIVSGKNYFNRDIDLGEGKNTLKFKETKDSKESIVFLADVKNATNIEVEDNVTFTSSTKITGVKEVKIAKDKVLEYRFIDKDRQAFADLASLKDGKLKVDNTGEFKILPIGQELQIGKAKDVLGYDIILTTIPATKIEETAKITIPATKIEETAKTTIPATKIEETVIADLNWIEDSRAIPNEKYSKIAYKAYIEDYKATNKNLLKDYLTNEKEFKEYLYNVTNNNPLMFIKAGNLSLSTEYHSLLADSKFVSKDQVKVVGNYLYHKDSFSGDNSIKFNGAYAKLTYGLSEYWNTSLYLGGGDLRVKADKEYKANNIMTGVELKYEKANLTWTNSLMHNRSKSSSLTKIDSYSLYTEGKYDIPISDTWSIIPKISLTATKLKNGSTEWNNLILEKKNENNLQVELGTSIVKNLLLDNSKITFSLGGTYKIQNKLKDVKAHWKDGMTRFPVKRANNYNNFTGEIGISYNHNNGISSKLLWKESNSGRTLNLRIGYIF